MIVYLFYLEIDYIAYLPVNNPRLKSLNIAIKLGFEQRVCREESPVLLFLLSLGLKCLFWIQLFSAGRVFTLYKKVYAVKKVKDLLHAIQN